MEPQMILPTPSFEWPADHRRRRIVVALCGGIALPACATGPADTHVTRQPTPLSATAEHEAAAITAITLERDCSGCPSGSRIELHRDGRAVATVTGKARRGTQDEVSQARLAPGDFDPLARAVVAAGFFGMPDTFEEPGLQDGAWATLTVARGAASKQVFRREEAGPPALKALEAAVLALQARLAFAPHTR